MSYSLDEYTFSWADNPNPNEDPTMQGLLDNEELPVPRASTSASVPSSANVDPFDVQTGTASQPYGANPFSSPPEVPTTSTSTSFGHTRSLTNPNLPNGSWNRFTEYDTLDSAISIPGHDDIHIRKVFADRQTSFLGDHDPDMEETIKCVGSSIIFFIVIVAFFLMIFLWNPAI